MENGGVDLAYKGSIKYAYIWNIYAAKLIYLRNLAFKLPQDNIYLYIFSHFSRNRGGVLGWGRGDGERD